MADDDVGGADIDLEADDLRARKACDDDKPKTAAGWAVERCRGRCDLIAEVVAEIDREAECEELWRRLDCCIDLEVEVLGEPGVVRSPQLVRVAALYDPLSPRG